MPYYAYELFDENKKDIANDWNILKDELKGKSHRVKKFKTKKAALAYLNEEEICELEAGIYFDAGTGRGEGFEFKVTNEKGESLLQEIVPKDLITEHQTHRIKEFSGLSNNFAELLACYTALKIALKQKEKKIFGDSQLVINYWSKNHINKTVVVDVNEENKTALESDLDSVIASQTVILDHIELEVNNCIIQNTREFHKKYLKVSSIKNKIQEYSYNVNSQILHLKVDTDWTQENTDSLDNVLDNLVGYDVVIQLMDGYQRKAKDGSQYYNLKRSELVNDIHLGLITSEDAFIIDSKLKNVKDSLLTGDWITAQTYLSFTTVEGEYTQERKDAINAEIQEYINNNY